MLWPEIRSAYRTKTGLELAKSNTDDFLGFVLEYSINGPDYQVQKREAIYAVLHDEIIEGADFHVQANTQISELDQLEETLRKGVE